MVFLKHRSLFNIITHRYLSSNRPTLYETLEVIETSTDVFTQPAETLFVFAGRKSVFGGQIIGSALYAAQKTLKKYYPLHSFQSYFLTAADNSSDISYTVSRLRDGKSFQTRNVTARQNDKIVYECSMNFHEKEKGNMEHQLPMTHTDIPLPEKLPSIYDHFRKLLDDKRVQPQFKSFVELVLRTPVPVDMRYCYPRDLLQPSPEWPAREFIWMKSMDPLPDDPYIHQSTVAYCSDLVLLGSAFLPYSLNIHHPRVKIIASLGHSMWFHDDFTFDITDETNVSKLVKRSSDIPTIPSKVPIRADDWLLYEFECPIHRNNCAWTLGRIWTRNGRLIVTCTQEGVIRCY